MELKLFLMFFIEGRRGPCRGRRGRKGAVGGRKGAVGGRKGAVGGRKGAVGGHTGAIRAIPGPSGAIWGRWPQVYFSPSRIVTILKKIRTITCSKVVISFFLFILCIISQKIRFLLSAQSFDFSNYYDCKI